MPLEGFSSMDPVRMGVLADEGLLRKEVGLPAGLWGAGLEGLGVWAGFGFALTQVWGTKVVGLPPPGGEMFVGLE
jgi:hypothetical protein